MVMYDDLLLNTRHAYLIGIGGAGMSSLARILKCRGLRVSGSDIRDSGIVQQLLHEGIEVHIGQKEARIEDADLVIYSSAIRKDHVELEAAVQMGLRVHHRAEVLSSILNHAKTSVAVTGTHGKTTTSSMIAFILSELGRNPTCMIGAEMLNGGTNALIGDRDLCVAEVDESDQSHELYAPNYAILTNLEEDHIDHYKELSQLENSFSRFLGNLKNPGALFYSSDDAVVHRVVSEMRTPRISFGLHEAADFSAQNIRLLPFGSEFDLMEAGFFAGKVKLQVPGVHNVVNSLGVIALLLHLGLDLDNILEALARFRGAKRRLEVKWNSPKCMVIDDYAHHPTEVRAALQALKQMGRPATVIFQPHRYTRTNHFYRDFAKVLFEAERLILTKVYAAGEKWSDTRSSDLIYDELIRMGYPNVVLLDRREVLDYLEQHYAPEGIFAFLGAGDIGEIAHEYANRLQNAHTTAH